MDIIFFKKILLWLTEPSSKSVKQDFIKIRRHNHIFFDVSISRNFPIQEKNPFLMWTSGYCHGLGACPFFSRNHFSLLSPGIWHHAHLWLNLSVLPQSVALFFISHSLHLSVFLRWENLYAHKCHGSHITKMSLTSLLQFLLDWKAEYHMIQDTGFYKCHKDVVFLGRKHIYLGKSFLSTEPSFWGGVEGDLWKY